MVRKDERSEHIEDAPKSYSKTDFYFSGRCLWGNVIRMTMEEARGVHLIFTDRRQTKLGIQRKAMKWFCNRRPQLKPGDLWDFVCEPNCGCIDCVCERAGLNVNDVVEAWRRQRDGAG